MIDELTALRLQIAWGADECIGDLPLDRISALPPSRPALVPNEAAAPLQRAVSHPTGPRLIGATPNATPTADTLDGLVAEWEAFAHPLRATATHTVRPDGNPNAGLMLIGEAPGSDDDRSGRAFDGPIGLTLDRVLASAGFARADMLLTTLVPWRPPGNRKLTDGEIQSCLPFIHRLLGIVRPQHIILVGAAPVRALTAETGTIRRLRGRWLRVGLADTQLPVSALAFPAIDQWLLNSATKQQLWSDLLTLKDAVTTPSK